jgi:hypothetical protein
VNESISKEEQKFDQSTKNLETTKRKKKKSFSLPLP